MGTSQHPNRGLLSPLGFQGSPGQAGPQGQKGRKGEKVPPAASCTGEAQSGGGQAMVPGEKSAPGGHPLLSIAPGSDVPVLVTKTSPLFSPQGDVGREGQEGVPGEAGRRVRACSSSRRAGLMGRGTRAVGSVNLLCSESCLLSPGQARQGRTPAPEGPPWTQGTWPGVLRVSLTLGSFGCTQRLG